MILSKLGKAGVAGLLLISCQSLPALTIDFSDELSESNLIEPFGNPDTTVYGQTFMAPSPTRSLLKSMSFFGLSYGLDETTFSGSGSVDYQFGIGLFEDGKMTSELFRSSAKSIMSRSAEPTFELMSSGMSIQLDPSKTYLAFVDASPFSSGLQNAVRLGAMNDGYDKGSFWYLNAGHENFGAGVPMNDAFSDLDLIFSGVFLEGFFVPGSDPTPVSESGATLGLLGGAVLVITVLRLCWASTDKVVR